MPAFPYIFIQYRGGGESDEVAQSIIELIKQLSPTEALQIDNIEAVIKRAGADYVKHPITIRAAILDLRRQWTLIESQDYLHSTIDNPMFLGTDRLSFFIAPEDTSKETEVKPGPQIHLSRLIQGPALR